MKNKHFLFLVVLLAFALFVFAMAFAGCSAENPICSTNFCAVGEIFPRSDLDDTIVFSEVDINDSLILATLISTPQPVDTTPIVEPIPTQPTPDNTVTLADIVSDVKKNGVASTYKEQTVTITATVKFNLVVNPGTGKSITLVTGAENISFFVTDLDTPETLRHYVEGNSYAFTIFIDDVTLSTINPDKKNVWSHEVD